MIVIAAVLYSAFMGYVFTEAIGLAGLVVALLLGVEAGRWESKR